MAYKRIFIDSDVLLDVLLERHPYFSFSQRVLTKAKHKGIEMGTSVLVIANIYSIMARTLGKVEAKKNSMRLLNTLKIFALDVGCINLAINSNFDDVEEGMQHFVATQNRCDLIVTRNIKDYKESQIPVLSAEHYLNIT